MVHVLKNLDRDRFRFDFLTFTTEHCAYDEELQKMGCRIIPCLRPHRPFQFSKSFLGSLKKFGPYDVIHSHVHHFSGLICWLARYSGVRMRIAHSHLDTSLADARAGFVRGIYLRFMKKLIKYHATHGVACSGKAAISLFGDKWQRDQRWHLLHCGIDLSPFDQSVSTTGIRSELGIHSDAVVIGHVGRFVEFKNHSFLLDIIAEAVARNPKFYGLLVGDGPLKSDLVEQAQRLGIEKQIIFAGTRSDIPRIMRGAMDVFLMPSHYEGLPLVLLEAQAAGLPCVISDIISSEADVVPELITRMSLSNSSEKWADLILMKTLGNYDQKSALARMIQSDFNIQESVNNLCSLYSCARG